MNTMTFNNYHARIEYDPDLDMFRGEIVGLNGGAIFWTNPQELRAEFKNSLVFCWRSQGGKALKPRRHYSVKFTLPFHPNLRTIWNVCSGKRQEHQRYTQEALRRVVE